MEIQKTESKIFKYIKEDEHDAFEMEIKKYSPFCLVNAKDKENRTILEALDYYMTGFEKSKINFFRRLIHHGVSVDATDQNGWTMLHYACNNRELNMVRFLLEYGANRNIKTHRGNTPEDLLTPGVEGSYRVFDFNELYQRQRKKIRKILNGVKLTKNDIESDIDENDYLKNIPHPREHEYIPSTYSDDEPNEKIKNKSKINCKCKKCKVKNYK